MKRKFQPPALRAGASGSVPPAAAAVRRPFKLPALKSIVKPAAEDAPAAKASNKPCIPAGRCSEQEVQAPTPAPAPSMAVAAGASSCESAPEAAICDASPVLPTAVEQQADMILAAGRSCRPKLPGLRSKARSVPLPPARAPVAAEHVTAEQATAGSSPGPLAAASPNATPQASLKPSATLPAGQTDRADTLARLSSPAAFQVQQADSTMRAQQPAAQPPAVQPPAAQPAAAQAPQGWRVLRLPAVPPEDLPCLQPPASMPTAVGLLSRLPTLPVPASSLVHLAHPALGDLAAAAQAVEAAVLPHLLPEAAPNCQEVAAAGGQRLLAAALAQHPLHHGGSRGRVEGASAGLLAALHQPLRKVVVVAAAGSAPAAAAAAAPAVLGPASVQPLAAAVTRPSAATAAAGAEATPGSRYTPPAEPGRKGPAGAPGIHAPPAAVPAAAAAIAGSRVQQPTPPAVDVAIVQRQLGEGHKIPLSYLRRLVFA